jgi:hypothetical protein
MSTVTLLQDEIVAGSPFYMAPSIIWTGATITGVKGVVVGTIEDGKAQVQITTPLSLTNISGTPSTGNLWGGVLSAAETMKLLVSPTDPTSKVAVKSPIIMYEFTGTDAGGRALKPVLYTPVLTIGRNPFYTP